MASGSRTPANRSTAVSPFLEVVCCAGEAQIERHDWIGPTNASTLLQLLGSRSRSSDPEKNPVVSIHLIADLHDAMAEHGDHELADGVLELARFPARYWVPSCSEAG